MKSHQTRIVSACACVYIYIAFMHGSCAMSPLTCGSRSSSRWPNCALYAASYITRLHKNIAFTPYTAIFATCKVMSTVKNHTQLFRGLTPCCCQGFNFSFKARYLLVFRPTRQSTRSTDITKFYYGLHVLAELRAIISQMKNYICCLKKRDLFFTLRNTL
jgi:hypothetical protein